MRITRRFTTSLPVKILALVGISALVVGLLVFVPSRLNPPAHASSNALTPFTITSPNFTDGGPISTQQEFNQQGCTGGNIAPELNWINVPSKTQSFALLMTDYDAPVDAGFHHWIVYNIPGNVRHLQGNNAFTEGTNSFGLIGYDGPCPPTDGETHHYLFLLYAVNIPNIGSQGMKFGEVIKAIRGHVVSATSIIGTFHLPI